MAVVILGGGLAGASLGFYLSRLLKPRPVILEAKEKPGGGSRGFSLFGQEVPLGARSIRLRPPTNSVVQPLLSELLGETGLTEERGAIAVGKYLVPFPIQAGFSKLPFLERIPYLMSYFFRPRNNPQNFREWVLNEWGSKLGTSIINHSAKCWKYSPEGIDIEAASKIRKEWKVDMLKRGLFGFTPVEEAGKISKVPMQSTELIKALIKNCDVITNCKIRRNSIDLEKKEIEVPMGTLTFDHLVSTIPLPAFYHLVKKETSKLSPEIELAFESLVWNTLMIVAIVVPRRIIGRAFLDVYPRMVYVPDPDIYFQRVSFASSYTSFDKLDPEEFEILIFEISIEKSFRAVYNEVFQEALKERCLADSKKMGLIKELPVKFIEPARKTQKPYSVQVLRPGYLIFERNYKWAKAKIKEWSSQFDLKFFGRFGAWDNSEVDQVFYNANQLAIKFKEEVDHV